MGNFSGEGISGCLSCSNPGDLVFGACSMASEVFDFCAETVELGVCPAPPAVVFSELLDSAHLLMPRAALVQCFHRRTITL